MSGHTRNTAAMLASPRCGASTRDGGACRAPAAHGSTRCRMHGGAVGSGPPRKNRNALKHGLFTKEACAEQRQIRDLLGNVWSLLEQLE